MLVTPKKELERKSKSEWLCGVELFRSNLNVNSVSR